MKKSKIITSTLVVASLLMGAGYAAWNDTVTFNHSVTTGELNVEFVENSSYAYSWDDYVSVSYSNDNTTANFCAQNMYPGTNYFCNVLEKNEGTIPAVFDSATVTISGTPEVIENMSAHYWIWVYHNDGSIEDLGYLDCPLTDIATDLTSYLSDVILNPGDSISLQGDSTDYFATYSFSEDADNDTMNGYVDFSIQFNWVQP